jgi:hypothetical protein
MESGAPWEVGTVVSHSIATSDLRVDVRWMLGANRAMMVDRTG